MGLHEIASVPKSCINMILREVSTAMLIAYFSGREMNSVSAAMTERKRLIFLFPFFFFLFFVSYFAIRGREAFQQIELIEEQIGYVKCWRKVLG